MNQRAKRFFYKIDGQGHPIPGTLARLPKKPEQGKWVEVAADVCCPVPNPCTIEGIGDLQAPKTLTLNNLSANPNIFIPQAGIVFPNPPCTSSNDTNDYTFYLYGNSPSIVFFHTLSCANYLSGNAITVTLYANGVALPGTNFDITTGDTVNWTPEDWALADEIRVEDTPEP